MSQVTARIGKDLYKTQLSTNKHSIIADEPDPLGTDIGPNPYDLLLMSLGSCVAMTLRMYADRKGWPLEAVEVQLSQERVHAKDCEQCKSDEGYVHFIEKRLKFEGPLTEKQIKRLLQISDRCPVNKTLTSEIKIENVLELV